MIEFLLQHAPTIGMLFFMAVFLGILVWVLRPGAKQNLQALAYIPLEDRHDGRP